MPATLEVWSALREVEDPEIQGLSIVDLGIVHQVDRRQGTITVELLPTFTACPALELIREAVEAKLAPLATDVDVRFTFAVPWTTDRITPAGRRHLEAIRIAPPRPAGGRDLPMLERSPAPCPACGSTTTTLENAFGATPCRALQHCSTCREPFEALKVV
jgi:ring-1,2-phenylacetyl-CoA epoxidase subunit PaaD